VVFRKNTIHREKDEIVLFTTRSHSVSQKCRNIVTFAKTLLTNPVNSETIVNRERENITELLCFLSHPTPLFKAFQKNYQNYQNTINAIKVYLIYQNVIGFWWAKI
jgi:hypothetical protein